MTVNWATYSTLLLSCELLMIAPMNMSLASVVHMHNSRNNIDSYYNQLQNPYHEPRSYFLSK